MELIVKIVILYTAVNQLCKDIKLFIHYLSSAGKGQVKLVSAQFNGIKIVKNKNPKLFKSSIILTPFYHKLQEYKSLLE